MRHAPIQEIPMMEQPAVPESPAGAPANQGIPGPRHADIIYRQATPTDGARMWELVQQAGTLELNPSYAYILICQHFGGTCLVAEKDGAIVGFVLAYIPPRQNDTVFVWQVGVSSTVRKRGVGIQLLRHLLALGDCRSVRYIEASVTPSNKPSQNLFRSFARKWGVPCRKIPFFPAEFFPEKHEAEDLYRVGPLEWPEA